MRVHTVQKSRKKSPGTCGACSKEIEVGQGYRYIEPRYGPKRVRHLDCPSFRASDMTSSDKLSRLYGAQEQIEDFMASWDGENLSDIESVLEEAANEAREVAEEYRESAQNMEDGLGTRTYMCDELEEKADSIDSWADELEQVTSSLDEWDEDQVRTEVTEEHGEPLPEDQQVQEEQEELESSIEDGVQEKKEEWIENVRSEVDSANSNLSI